MSEWLRALISKQTTAPPAEAAREGAPMRNADTLPTITADQIPLLSDGDWFATFPWRTFRARVGRLDDHPDDRLDAGQRLLVCAIARLHGCTMVVRKKYRLAPRDDDTTEAGCSAIWLRITTSNERELFSGIALDLGGYEREQINTAFIERARAVPAVSQREEK